MGRSCRRSRARAGEIARQQSMFREVNERIEEISDRFGPSEQPLLIVCECGRIGCTELLGLTAAEYEALRQSPMRFAVARGHEIAGIEHVVATNDRFSIVEKVGSGGRTAASLDPRRA